MRSLSSYIRHFVAKHLVFVFVVLSSCGDGIVSNKYCSLPAKFTFTPVNSISQLYTSLNSPGEWCTVTIDASGNKFLFRNLSSTGEANRTALDGYTSFYMGLSGFIVGLPNIPELGSDLPVITCYDLACSNCYADYSVARRLTLQEGGLARCSSCKRIYDLNNTGIVSSGSAGQPLYRYRVYYGNNTLSINNR